MSRPSPARPPALPNQETGPDLTELETRFSRLAPPSAPGPSAPSSPSSPASPISPSARSRFRISDLFKRRNHHARKLTKDKALPPVPGPPGRPDLPERPEHPRRPAGVGPERPGTPLAADSYRPVLSYSPTYPERPANGQDGNGPASSPTKLTKPQAPPPTHNRVTSDPPSASPSRAYGSANGYTNGSPVAQPQASNNPPAASTAFRQGQRVVSAPPAQKGSPSSWYTPPRSAVAEPLEPIRPWHAPALATPPLASRSHPILVPHPAYSPNGQPQPQPPRQYPPTLVTPPGAAHARPHSASQTYRYALVADGEDVAYTYPPPHPSPSPTRMQMPIPQAAPTFAPLPLSPYDAPTPPHSAPPYYLGPPDPNLAPLVFGASSSAYSLNSYAPPHAPHTPTHARATGSHRHPSAHTATPPNANARTSTNADPPRPAPRRPRANSSPASPTLPVRPSFPPSSTSPAPSPTSAKPTVQCSGITKSGAQCQRLVRAVSALAYLDPGVPLERYCHQHARDMMEPSGFYTRARAGAGDWGKAERWVEFDEWIPSYLSPATQILLRTTMELPVSPSDTPGYIYTYELRGPIPPSASAGAGQPVMLKVGRAVNVKNRLGEWGKQCGKEVVLRGVFPEPGGGGGGGGSGETQAENGMGAAVGDEASRLRGKLRTGEKARYSHRLERLIHIELADVSVYSTHLTPEFLEWARGGAAGSHGQGQGQGRQGRPRRLSGVDSAGSTPSRPGNNNGPPPSPGPGPSTPTRPARRPLVPCSECGKVHQEIFAFDRVGAGPLRGREWEGVVRPVVGRWGRFVQEVLDDGGS